MSALPSGLMREAQIDVGAIASNVRHLKRLTGVEVIAVVKADGYGHGAARAALAALEGGATRLGVADIDEALQAVELRGAFDASRTADETAGKPNPKMLDELMREFGVAPERTLMIGDTTHDLQMAVNAGCASVGVSYGAHEPQAFHALNPRFVAHTVPELHQWLLANA